MAHAFSVLRLPHEIWLAMFGVSPGRSTSTDSAPPYPSFSKDLFQRATVLANCSYHHILFEQNTV